MKKGIFVALFAMFALIASAQLDYSSYLNKALEKLEAGDCESAQKNYDLYKELSGEVKNSVQVMIDDCQKTKTKTYTLGEEILFNNVTYVVAWLSDDKDHGLALCSGGSTTYIIPRDTYAHGGHLITLDELAKIIPNKNAVRISGLYWTSTIAKKSYNWDNTKLWVVDVESKNKMQVSRKRSSYYWRESYNLLYVIEF